MENKEPTKEQVKEFWAKVLQECVHDWDKTLIAGVSPDIYACVCKKCGRKFDFCHGKVFAYGSSYEFPPIDLNNLFKYAVPIAVERIAEECKMDLVEAKLLLFHEWFNRIRQGLEDVLALFWALDKVMKEII